MPYYDHDKDYPFAAFITNLGKYNEGELVGEWVKFPTTAEELKEVFKRIGIGQKDDFGQPYEEWFITDYDCYVDGLYSKLGEYENLDELNYLASKLDEMSESEYAQFQAGMEMGDHCGSLQEIINLTENLDCYEIYPNIEDYDDKAIMELLTEKNELEHRLQKAIEQNAAREGKEEKVQEVLQIADMLKNHPMKFDDKMLRKLLKRVEVLSTEEILITFAGGRQMREKMQDTLKRMPIRKG